MTILLSEEIIAFLKRVGKEQGVSASEVVRQAVESKRAAKKEA